MNRCFLWGLARKFSTEEATRMTLAHQLTEQDATPSERIGTEKPIWHPEHWVDGGGGAMHV